MQITQKVDRGPEKMKKSGHKMWAQKPAAFTCSFQTATVPLDTAAYATGFTALTDTITMHTLL